MQKVLKHFMLIAVVSLAACSSVPDDHAVHNLQQEHPASVVAVHPGTELLHVINYLAGVARPMVASYSYRDDVDAWFAPYADHPAVIHARALPYNDFVELGWAFDSETMALQIPEGFGWQGLMVAPDYLHEYLRLSADFAQESNFLAFFVSQQANYKVWVEQFEARLRAFDPEPVVWDFFALPPDERDTTLYYSISPLGVTLRANLIMHEVRPNYAHYGVILIPFDPRYLHQEGEVSELREYSEPAFDYSESAMQQAVWHEATHVIYESLVADNMPALSAITYRDCFFRMLSVFDDEGLNTYFFIHEVMADAVAIFLKDEYVSSAAAEHHLVLNENLGGKLYRPLVSYLRENYFDSRHERSFRQQLPDIINYINALEPTHTCD